MVSGLEPRMREARDSSCSRPDSLEGNRTEHAASAWEELQVWMYCLPGFETWLAHSELGTSTVGVWGEKGLLLTTWCFHRHWLRSEKLCSKQGDIVHIVVSSMFKEFAG